MSDREWILEVEDVAKAYTLGSVRLEVLRNIQWRVRRGEWAALLGASGSGKKELQDQFIGREMDRLLQDRGQILAGNQEPSYIKVVADMKEFRDEAICPIISEGDVIGSVVLLNKDQKKKFGEVEQRVASSAADFLGRQMS